MMQLTFHEQETRAYMAGNTALAAMYAEAAEATDAAEALDDERDAIEEEAYQRGRADASDAELVALVDDLKASLELRCAEIERLRATLKALRTDLGVGGKCSKADGRKEWVKAIAARHSVY